MGAFPMIRDWRAQVRGDLLPDLHGHQANALADLSFAMAIAQHCHSGKLAAVAPGDTTPAATRRPTVLAGSKRRCSGCSHRHSRALGRASTPSRPRRSSKRKAAITSTAPTAIRVARASACHSNKRSRPSPTPPTSAPATT